MSLFYKSEEEKNPYPEVGNVKGNNNANSNNSLIYLIKIPRKTTPLKMPISNPTSNPISNTILGLRFYWRKMKSLRKSQDVVIDAVPAFPFNIIRITLRLLTKMSKKGYCRT